MPSLSIILPIYNVESFLAQCLDSILVGNQFTGEVICINDGSTDHSSTILQQYALLYSNVRVVNQLNKGLGAARNVGLKEAKGDYVFFVDSDDWLFPQTIAQVMARLNGEDVLYFNARKVYESTGVVDSDCDIREYSHISGTAYFVAVQEERRNMPCVCVGGGVYLREFLIKNKLWNEQGIYHEDELFTPQVMLKATNVSSINVYVYAYRIRSGSITAAVTKKHVEDQLFINRKLFSIYQKYKDLPTGFYHRLSLLYSDLICSAEDNNIDIVSLWSDVDKRCYLQSAIENRQRKVARLSIWFSPRIGYKYMKDQLPGICRKLVNRYL